MTPRHAWLGLLLAVACDRRGAPVVPPVERAPVEPLAQRQTDCPPTQPSTPAVAAPGDPLADVTIPARPDWMDRFAAENQGDMRFFEISTLMKRHELTRDRAVELQNHFRDLSRAEPSRGPAAWYEQALARAQSGEFEDRRETKALRDAAFIVVFDLDETLYDQSYDAAVAQHCHDLEVGQGEQVRRVKLAPGAGELLDRVAALGGAVVIFSAAPDDRTLANLRAWEFGGRPLPEHPAIAGVLTNSHLVLQTKHEGPGAGQPRKGRPVPEPSKDLRIFDEPLRRVILVDDNPTRTFQPANLRVVKKFDAELYCSTKDTRLREAFERSLPAVADEIEESVRYVRTKGGDFATAFLPYTQIGQLALELLRAGGMSRRAAIAYVRAHPEIIEREF